MGLHKLAGILREYKGCSCAGLFLWLQLEYGPVQFKPVQPEPMHEPVSKYMQRKYSNPVSESGNMHPERSQLHMCIPAFDNNMPDDRVQRRDEAERRVLRRLLLHEQCPRLQLAQCLR